MVSKDSLELSFNFAGDSVRVLGYGEILLTPNRGEKAGL